MTPTTITNDDGTFSPAIVLDGVTWVNVNFSHKSEDRTLKHARADLDELNRLVFRLLMEGHYKVHRR